MKPEENLKYKCTSNSNIDVLVLHAMTSLNLIEDNPLNGNLNEEFEKWYDKISFLGNSWQEINEAFQNHLIDCYECRDLYVKSYKTFSAFLEGYYKSATLSETKKLLQI